MGLSSRSVTRITLVLLALVLLAIVIDGLHWRRQLRWNADISASRQAATDPDDDRPSQLRFADAYAKAAGGDRDGALKRYRSLDNDPALGLAARYNSANLLMRQAVAERAGPEPGNAIAPIELAKEFYRDVLRADPRNWDARYNLERAQRLLPDPAASDATPPEAQPESERAATTMRGYSPGLP